MNTEYLEKKYADMLPNDSMIVAFQPLIIVKHGPRGKTKLRKMRVYYIHKGKKVSSVFGLGKYRLIATSDYEKQTIFKVGKSFDKI